MSEPPRVDASCAGLLQVAPDCEDRTAVYRASGEALWTRSELRSRVADLAETFTTDHKGLVVLLCRSEPQVLCALLACIAAGHAVMLLEDGMEPTALARLIEAYDPDFVVAPAESELPDAADRLSSTREGLQVLTARRRGAAIDDELCVLLSTSGTTGSAKFVRLSAANLIANADQIRVALDVRPGDVGIGHLPLNYSYGLSVATSHLRAGAAVHLWADSITIPDFWHAVGRSGGTHFPGVPFHYSFLARSEIGKLAPASVRTFTQAGGALDPRIQLRMHEMLDRVGRRFFVMYGQTEAAPRITTLPHGKLLDKLGSVGPALPGGRLHVVDDAGEALPAGAVGRVVYEGPNVMLGYAERREDLLLGDVQNGRLETGDVGRLDEDGYLFLTGRVKRFAKLHGLRISLDEVEARFRSAGEVAAVEGRNAIVLFTPTPDSLAELLGTVAAEYRIPTLSFSVRKLADFPRNSNGKVDYRKLEAANELR